MLAGGYGDGLGYGYHLSKAGETLSVDLTLDLGAATPITKVGIRRFDDRIHDYSADNVQVLVDGVPIAETGAARDQWFELAVPATTTRYLTIRLTKTRTHDFADYLFVDEVVVT